MCQSDQGQWSSLAWWNGRGWSTNPFLSPKLSLSKCKRYNSGKQEVPRVHLCEGEVIVRHDITG